MFKDLQDYVAGKTYVTASDMNELRKVTQFLNNFFGQNALADVSGFAFRRQPIIHDFIWARITDVYDDGYPWEEIRPKADGTFETPDGGRKSDNDGVAYEANGSTDDLTEQYVLLRRGVAADDGTRTWTFGNPTSGVGNQLTVIDIKGAWSGAPLYKCEDCATDPDTTVAEAPDMSALLTSHDVAADGSFGSGNHIFVRGGTGTNNIAINLAEIGMGTHDVTTGATNRRTLFMALRLPNPSNEGKGVFVFDSRQWQFCS